MMKLKSLILLFLVGINLVSAQTFEGVVTYKISLINPPAEMKEMQGMLPETMDYVLKGNKTRMEMDMMGGSVVTIMDGETKTSNVLMNMMGQKIHTQSTSEDFEKSMDLTDVKVHAGEAKEIAGYICKKITGKSTDGFPLEIYYTEEIQSGTFNEMLNKIANVNGMPLEFTVTNKGMQMLLTAQKIQPKSVEDELFEIPDGYQKVEGNPLGGG